MEDKPTGHSYVGEMSERHKKLTKCKVALTSGSTVPLLVRTCNLLVWRLWCFFLFTKAASLSSPVTMLLESRMVVSLPSSRNWRFFLLDFFWWNSAVTSSFSVPSKSAVQLSIACCWTCSNSASSHNSVTTGRWWWWWWRWCFFFPDEFAPVSPESKFVLPSETCKQQFLHRGKLRHNVMNSCAISYARNHLIFL